MINFSTIEQRSSKSNNAS